VPYVRQLSKAFDQNISQQQHQGIACKKKEESLWMQQLLMLCKRCSVHFPTAIADYVVALTKSVSVPRLKEGASLI
jgi:hypothetical protein